LRRTARNTSWTLTPISKGSTEYLGRSTVTSKSPINTSVTMRSSSECPPWLLILSRFYSSLPFSRALPPWPVESKVADPISMISF
jgi:hypothetical protein